MKFKVGQRVRISFLDHAEQQDINGLEPPTTEVWEKLEHEGVITFTGKKYIALDLQSLSSNAEEGPKPVYRWWILKSCILEATIVEEAKATRAKKRRSR